MRVRSARKMWTALSCGYETFGDFLNPHDRLRGEYSDDEIECLAKIRRRIVARAYPNGGRVAGKRGRLVRLR